MKQKHAANLDSLNEIVLFPFDDYAIPFQQGVRLSLNSYSQSVRKKSNSVLSPGNPGTPDDSEVQSYGTVLKVGDELWMWYCAENTLPGDYTRVCFAKSPDGKNFTRPNLGLVEFNGSKANNLIDLPVGERVQACIVYHDADEQDPDRRFKMCFESPKYGTQMAVAFSADGLRWNLYSGNPVGPSLEQAGGVKFNGAYYVSGHGPGHWRPENGALRQMVTHMSYDFENWTQASCLGFRRDSIPPRTYEVGGHSGPQVHLGSALWNRGNTIVGFYGMWNGHPSNDRRLTWMDLGLTVSHDGLHFREPIPDFPIVRAAEIGWKPPPLGDSVAYFPALVQGQGFENIGAETLYWYSRWPISDSDGVRVASWPKDRLGFFQSFTGPDTKSFIISASFELENRGVEVFVNADGLGLHSQLTVSILSESFEDISGFASNNSSPLTASGYYQKIKWGEESIITHSTSIRIRIDFHGLRPEDVKLYAIYLKHV